MTKCPYCKIKMKTDRKPMSFKLSPNVIVESVSYHICPNCGFESIPENECRKIEKKIQSVIELAKEAKIVII